MIRTNFNFCNESSVLYSNRYDGGYFILELLAYGGGWEEKLVRPNPSINAIHDENIMKFSFLRQNFNRFGPDRLKKIIANVLKKSRNKTSFSVIDQHNRVSQSVYATPYVITHS